MNATAWKYTDATRRVVYRVNEDGSMESHLASIPLIRDWIESGNSPLAEDAGTEPE